MSKSIQIISFFLILVLSNLSCFEDDASLVNPQEVSGSTPAVPPGAITMTASTLTISQLNPVTTILFSASVEGSTITYGPANTVHVQYPPGTDLTDGVDYIAVPAAPAALTPYNSISLDLTATGITTGNTVRIILTNGLQAFADGSALTNPGNFDLVVQ